MMKKLMILFLAAAVLLPSCRIVKSESLTNTDAGELMEYSPLGTEYAKEEKPLDSLLDTIIAQLHANGFEDVKIVETEEFTAENLLWQSNVNALKASLSMLDSGKTVTLSLIMHWDPKSGGLISFNWFGTGMDMDPDAERFCEILLSDETFKGGSQIIKNLKENTFFENKMLILYSLGEDINGNCNFSGSLLLAPGTISRENDYFYTDLGGEAVIIYVSDQISAVIPDHIGGLPVTGVTLGGYTDDIYAGIPDGVRSVDGTSYAAVLVLPSSVEKINYSLLVNPYLEAVLSFNPDLTLCNPEFLESSIGELYSAPIVRFFTDSESVRQTLKPISQIEVLTIEELYAGFQEDMQGKEYMLEALEKGDYSYAHEVLIDTFGWGQ